VKLHICLWQGFVGLCICLIFGVGLVGAVIVSLTVDATHKFEEAAKICFALCACSLISLITVSIMLLHIRLYGSFLAQQLSNNCVVFYLN